MKANNSKNIVFSKVRPDQQTHLPEEAEESEHHELTKAQDQNQSANPIEQAIANNNNQTPNAFMHAEMYNYALTLQSEQSHHRTNLRTKTNNRTGNSLLNMSTQQWLENERRVRDKERESAANYQQTIKEFQAQERHHAVNVAAVKLKETSRRKKEQKLNSQHDSDQLDARRLQFISNTEYLVFKNHNTGRESSAFQRASALTQQQPAKDSRKNSLAKYSKAAGQKVIDMQIQKLMWAICKQAAQDTKNLILERGKIAERMRSSRKIAK